MMRSSDLAKTTEQLQAAGCGSRQESRAKRMEQAARNPGGRSPGQSGLAEADGGPKQQMGDKAGSPDAADQLKKISTSLGKDAAKGMAENPSGRPTP